MQQLQGNKQQATNNIQHATTGFKATLPKHLKKPVTRIAPVLWIRSSFLKFK
jgi:hypothetical protein